MKRREFLTAATVSMAWALLTPHACIAQDGAGARPPNIVFVCVDDMDFSELGCYGGRVLTPHIDRLAAEGMRFDRYYVTSSVCTPSRYSALTGRYASRSKVFAERNRGNATPCIGWDTHLDPATSTIQSVLRDNGYTTGFVGKWHLTKTNTEWKKVKGKTEIDADTLRLMQDDYAKNMETVRQCGFDHADAVYAQNLRAIAMPKIFECMNLDWKVDRALHFIDQNRNKPFFLYLATNAPHTTVVKESAYLVNEFRKDTRYTPNGVLTERPKAFKGRDALLDRVRKAGLPSGTVVASWIDAGVGAIVTKLEELGLRDDTIVIFTSDHQSIGKFTCYEGSRSPCIVSGARAVGTPGRGTQALVANIDLAPTIFDLCGVRGQESLDGTSFAPVLQGKADQVRDSLLLETACCRAVVTADRWKYIATRFSPQEIAKICAGSPFFTNGTGLQGYWRNNPETVKAYPNMGQFNQLYDLKGDPRETTNLYEAKQRTNRVTRLREQLREQLAKLPLAFAEFADAK